MASVIGTVWRVLGDVFAVAGDGAKRLLVAGDRVFIGEQVQAGSDGAVAIRLENGRELTLGRDSRVLLDAAVLDDQAPHVETLDPLTPTLGIVTAADHGSSSEAEANAGGGGHTVVMLSETGGEVLPVVGFATEGLVMTPIFPEGRDVFVRDGGEVGIPPANVIPPAPEPPFVEPPATEPPITEPPIIEPPVTEPPVTEPPLPPTNPPVEPPTEPPVEPPGPPVEPPVDHCVSVSGSELTLHEANLCGGSAPDPAALTQTGSFTVKAPDGLQSLVVGGVEIVRAGVVMDFSQPVLTALGNSLSITGYDPVSGQVSYSYTLLNPLAHPDGEGANTLGETIEVVAVDHDGDVGTGQLDIVIVDDQPLATDIALTVTPVPQDSNLLLIIDNSDSMKGASGVDGLSRLDLAKQAINQLLDQYAAMGEVRVQIVTFNSQADLPGSVWVDVASARDIINALEAGNGTNYDAALAAAQHAFLSAGSLTGAQNLAYFLSDGNPTLSPEHSEPNHQPDPSQGDGIDAGEQAIWTAFLDAHGIKSFAIGIGSDVSQTYLDPIAHDGQSGTDMRSVIVLEPRELNAVLSGTVQGSTEGSLLAGGTFGADGGFVKVLMVDGLAYTYDRSGQGSVSGGAGQAHFNSAVRTLTLTTQAGGTLVVNMESGAFSYTPGSSRTPVTENIGYVLSDHDGDLAGATLSIHVRPCAPTPAPEAVADHIITNILAPSIDVPAAVLLANDHSPSGDPLSATPTVFQTGWRDAASDFSSPRLDTIRFCGREEVLENRIKDLQRADFHVTHAATATVLLSGYLGAWQGDTFNHQDLYSVELKAGEKLTVDTRQLSDQVGLAWQMDDGEFHSLAADGSFTASEDSVYRLILIHQPDPGVPNEGMDYQLGLSIDYSQVNTTPRYQGSYSIQDAHGGQGAAAVSIDYQHGPSLIGTDGDDVLLAAGGNDCLNGGNGNDVLIGGPGDDVLTGGEGQDRFMWLAGDTGHDRVTDFNVGIDSLDLSKLLQGMGAKAETLEDFLHVRVSGVGTQPVSTLEVGVDAGHPSQSIELAGVDLAAQFGVTPGAGGWIAGGADTATIINGMLGDHSLKVDVV
ncbi:retention module-containing protein [Pseudomonas viridiflava]|uniref:retention module-containing protein n=1 Tax=Pseudomonas viridiflava TaxID=33069 RepID=UPI000F019993|nr:retention module-containing protein [Pseudomonas viridiflava]